MIFLPSPPLRMLARLRLRGALRRQMRRVRTPAGAAFALLGAGMLTLWVSSVAVGLAMGDRAIEPEAFRAAGRAGGALLVLLSLGGSLSHRGLFLPPDEVEPLLAAPVSRADLVRYRLGAGALRSLFAALLLGLVVGSRAPDPLFGFLGLALALPVLGVVGQLVAILSGALEGRFAKRLARVPWLLLLLLAAVGLGVLGAQGGGLEGGAVTRFLGRVGGLVDHPVGRAALLPLEPWLRAMSATTTAEFLPWAALCVVLWVLLVELVAHLPVDFRELSLETAANVAQRIRRQRRGGGGASSSRVRSETAGWRVPLLFGRGPFGALAWRKCVSIVRRARGTLLVSGLVLALLTAVSSTMGSQEDPGGQLAGTAFLVVVGAIYLGGGLRFDFREDLDRMEVVKTWPVAPTRLFLATILPEVVLVSGLLAVAVLIRAAWVGVPPAAAVPVALGLPLVVLAWLAIDNLVFLLLPVRFVPGQEGALQNVGRAMVLSLLRLVVLVAVLGLAALLGGGAWLLARHALDAGALGQLAAATVGGLAAILVVDAALLALGGRALARFDVSRDRA